METPAEGTVPPSPKLDTSSNQEIDTSSNQKMDPSSNLNSDTASKPEMGDTASHPKMDTDPKPTLDTSSHRKMDDTSSKPTSKSKMDDTASHPKMDTSTIQEIPEKDTTTSVTPLEIPEKEASEDYITSDPLAGFEFSPPRPIVHYNLTPDPTTPGPRKTLNSMGFPMDQEIDVTQILAPDHPLLDRFQQSLKDQLTKRIYCMGQEVADLEEGYRKRNAEKEAYGVEAYEIQQNSNKQREEIDSCLQEIESVVAAKEEVEFQITELNTSYEYEKEVVMNTEKEEIEIRNELESVDNLLSQMKQWEDEIESDLMVNQRILDNTERYKDKLNADKKRQDAIVFNLMREVWRLESEMETCLMQLRVREEDRERLAEAVAIANIDVESNQAEHRYLLHGWQSVLVTINQRDKYYDNLHKEFIKIDDIYTSVTSELHHIKKEIHQEHLENERLTMIKDRLDSELKVVAKSLENENEKREQHLKVTSNYEKFIEENKRQRDILKTQIDYVHEQEHNLSKELEARNQLKFEMEQEIVANFQSNAFNSDAARQMTNVLKDIKEENRRKRIGNAKVEGQISHTHAEWQARKLEQIEILNQLAEIKRIMTIEDTDLAGIHKEYDNCEKELSKLITHYELLKQKSAGDAAQKLEMWPQEVRIRQLEATKNDLVERNKQSQSFWLREQAIVVDLSEKRQEQIKDMNLVKKQIMIMDHKNLRINSQLEELSIKEEALNRNICSLETKLYLCTNNLNKKKDSRLNINHSNNKIQTNLMMKLESSEFESLKLKAEIIEIEEDKLQLSKELVEKNREFLVWDRKLQLIEEARQEMHDSESQTGDICQMKVEIHRMNVRYTQLKRVQDKLIHDLDNCVYRRDSIVTLAEAKTRGHKAGSTQWRITFNKKLDETKTKLENIRKDLENIKIKIETKIKKGEQTKVKLTESFADIQDITEKVKLSQDNVEKARVDRQLKLDILLYKQKKLKLYTELARGRKPYMQFSTQKSAHTAYSRERELNNKLRSIVEEIQNDLPQHVYFFTKLHNSLVLPALSL